MVGYQHAADPKGVDASGKESSEMNTVSLDLEEDVVALLHQFNQPLRQTARELIVLELYRRGTISSGKAAELIGMERQEFIHHASSLGIPYFAMTEDEWDTERRRSETL
jgi:predicted HTH domain antitoxin